jgi:hypothetical protein
MRSLPFFALLALIFAFGAPTQAAQKEPRPGARPLYGELSYRDGREARRVWLDPAALLEFDGSDATAKLLRSLDASAVPTAYGRHRLWQLKGIDAGTALRAVEAKRPGVRLAPVYRDAPSSAGRARALTGELLLSARLGAAERARLLEKHALLQVRSLPAPTHALVVRPRGRADPLKLAETISTEPGVRQASAVWWLESKAR